MSQGGVIDPPDKAPTQQSLNGVTPPIEEIALGKLSSPDELSKKKWVGYWVLAATIIASSMAFIDGTVINVALPALQADLQATAIDLQWIVEAYAIFLSALILVGGSLGDKFGRRRIFVIGIIMFAATSAWAGSIATPGQLIVARIFQGVGGALLVPGSLAIINAYFDEAERGQAIGIWSGFSAITTALGPVIGGWLIENSSWRWVFFINLPLAVIVLWVVYLRVPESRDEEATDTVDWLGSILVTVGLGGIVFGFIESANLGLMHPLVLIAFIGGTASLIAFVKVEQYSEAPIMPLHLFQSRTFTGANILTLFLYGAMGAALFFLPFNLIQVQDYSATAAGAAFLPAILIIFILSPLSGNLVNRFGARWPMIIGSLIVAVGYLLLAVLDIGGNYWRTIFIPIVVLGLGMAITVPPLTVTVMGSVDTRYSGAVSGINNAMSRVAVVLAIAILGVFVLTSFNNNLDRQIAPLNLPQSVETHLEAERIKLAGAELPEDIDEALQIALSKAIDDSFVMAFRLIMFIGAGLCVGSAFTAYWMIDDKLTSPEQKPLVQNFHA
ncbi:MAG: MFS transporter [Chloroflexota bacterium]